MENSPSYYAIVPAVVRYDRNVIPAARLLYGEITALCNQMGYCWAGNSYFEDLYGVSNTTVTSWINSLVKSGHITRTLIYKEGTKQIVQRRLYIVDADTKEILLRGASFPAEATQEKLPTPTQEKLPDNNTDINNKDNITFNSIEHFDSFWKFYPRKAGKSQAMVAWRKLTLDQPTLIAIATNIQTRIASGEWAEENMQYIPHASTFLNQKRWEDEVITKKAKGKSSSIRNTSIVDSLTDRSWAD